MLYCIIQQINIYTFYLQFVSKSFSSTYIRSCILNVSRFPRLTYVRVALAILGLVTFFSNRRRHIMCIHPISMAKPSLVTRAFPLNLSL